jgi:hypothetical protein
LEGEDGDASTDGIKVQLKEPKDLSTRYTHRHTTSHRGRGFGAWMIVGENQVE